MPAITSAGVEIGKWRAGDPIEQRRRLAAVLRDVLQDLLSDMSVGELRGQHGAIRLDDARLLCLQHGHATQDLVFPQALSAGSYHPDWFAAMLPAFQAELEDGAQRGHNLREAETCLRLTLLAYRSAAQEAQLLSCTQALDLAAV